MTPTIKSLAAELGVSEQALRGWCKRNGIQKTTKGKITSYIITAEVAEQIKNHYTKPHNESESKTQRKSNESNTTKAYIDNLLQQIEDLKADKDKLNARLDKAEETISNLTAALQAAQALHGIEKKQAVIELTKEEPQQESADDQTEAQELNFFRRLRNFLIHRG